VGAGRTRARNTAVQAAWLVGGLAGAAVVYVLAVLLPFGFWLL
jgi:hypothetical protein